MTDDGTMRLALVRGDRRLNEIKLQNALGQPFRPATEEEILDAVRRGAGLHRPGRRGVEVVADLPLEQAPGWRAQTRRASTCAASRRAATSRPRFADIGTVEEGDTCPHGGTIHIEPAIEVGNIFKLGTRYSEPLGATYLDEDGKEQPIVMGSYGIGPARIAAAAIEQYADEHGISWPRRWRRSTCTWSAWASRAPRSTSWRSGCTASCGGGLDVLYDDRDMRPGEKFVGGGAARLPLRVVAGKRSLEAGELEVQVRRGTEKRAVPIEGAAERSQRCSPSSRDRTGRRHAEAARAAPGGPEPPATRAGQPLRPLTLPNLIGFARIGLLGVFARGGALLRRRARAAVDRLLRRGRSRLPRRDARAA